MTPSSQENPLTANTAPVPAPDASDWEPIPLQRGSPVNISLLVGSVLLTLWTGFGDDRERLIPWIISEFPAYSPACLLEIRHGQIWRLFTPAFLHFSVAHLGFNALNLIMLGNLLERRLRSGHYLLIAAVIALCSDLGQYFISGHPFFGGMSGVVYGLIGYVGLRGHLDPTFGLKLPTQSLVLALVWFVMCFTGQLGPIANGAHAVGLIAGVIWGYADAQIALRTLHARPSRIV